MNLLKKALLFRNLNTIKMEVYFIYSICLFLKMNPKTLLIAIKAVTLSQYLNQYEKSLDIRNIF